jgi:hypothetical protein
MNKLGPRPSTILMKAQPNGSRRIRSTTKVLGATLGILFALCGTIGICSFAFNAIKARTSVPKGLASTPIVPAVKASPTVPADKDNGTVVAQPATNQSETATADGSKMDQKSTPAASPAPPSVPVPPDERKASVNDRDFLESKAPEPKAPDRQLSGVVRKNLEKGRREAERKRSRLEEMYQKHEISSEAYKQGEEEYKSAIEKYRAALNAGREPKSESSGSF